MRAVKKTIFHCSGPKIIVIFQGIIFLSEFKIRRIVFINEILFSFTFLKNYVVNMRPIFEELNKISALTRFKKKYFEVVNLDVKIYLALPVTL